MTENHLNKLLMLMKNKGIKYQVEIAEDPDLMDDSVTIFEKTQNGKVIYIQVANDFTDRTQKNYILKLFDEKKGESIGVLQSDNVIEIVENIEKLKKIN